MIERQKKNKYCKGLELQRYNFSVSLSFYLVNFWEHDINFYNSGIYLTL